MLLALALIEKPAVPGFHVNEAVSCSDPICLLSHLNAIASCITRTLCTWGDEHRVVHEISMDGHQAFF